MRNCIVNHISFFWIPYQNYTKLLRFDLIPFFFITIKFFSKWTVCACSNLFQWTVHFQGSDFILSGNCRILHTYICQFIVIVFNNDVVFNFETCTSFACFAANTTHKSWRLLVDVANIYRITGISVFVKLPIEHKSKLYRS